MATELQEAVIGKQYEDTILRERPIAVITHAGDILALKHQLKITAHRLGLARHEIKKLKADNRKKRERIKELEKKVYALK